MKKSKIVLLLFILIAANVINVNAQKLDEGKVVYNISYPDADMPDEQMAMMPTEFTTYFKDNQARTEIKMGMGMGIVILIDNKSKTMTQLMDMMGNKTAVKMSEEEVKKDKEMKGKTENQVKLTDETKDIAGYKCKKAVVTGKDGSFDMYYTDQISYKNGDWVNDFKGIDGFPMEYKVTQDNIAMNFTAKKISKEKVDDAMFTIPADYTLKTQEELKKMYGGGK